MKLKWNFSFASLPDSTTKDMTDSVDTANGQALTSMIVVSNRLPFALKRSQEGQLSRHASAGGLVTAMAPVVYERKGLWIGWPGVYLGK